MFPPMPLMGFIWITLFFFLGFVGVVMFDALYDLVYSWIERRKMPLKAVATNPQPETRKSIYRAQFGELPTSPQQVIERLNLHGVYAPTVEEIRQQVMTPSNLERELEYAHLYWYTRDDFAEVIVLLKHVEDMRNFLGKVATDFDQYGDDYKLYVSFEDESRTGKPPANATVFTAGDLRRLLQ